jgi:hypothetical protein
MCEDLLRRNRLRTSKKYRDLALGEWKCVIRTLYADCLKKCPSWRIKIISRYDPSWLDRLWFKIETKLAPKWLRSRLRKPHFSRNSIQNGPGEDRRASDGDAVVVAAGTYAQNIHLNGKNIALFGTDPTDRTAIENTIIDGNSTGSVIQIESVRLQIGRVQSSGNRCAGTEPQLKEGEATGVDRALSWARPPTTSNFASRG